MSQDTKTILAKLGIRGEGYMAQIKDLGTTIRYTSILGVGYAKNIHKYQSKTLEVFEGQGNILLVHDTSNDSWMVYEL